MATQHTVSAPRVPQDIFFLSQMEREFYLLIREVQHILSSGENDETLQHLVQLLAPVAGGFEQRRVGISLEQVMQSAQQEFHALDRARDAAGRVAWPIGNPVGPGDLVTWLLFEAERVEKEANTCAASVTAGSRDWGQYAATLRAYSAWMFLLGAQVQADFSQLLHHAFR